MLTVATHNSAAPYFAVTAGPDSHSPPPMAEAPITSPGPIIAIRLCFVNLGASINSPVVQRGMFWNQDAELQTIRATTSELDPT